MPCPYGTLYGESVECDSTGESTNCAPSASYDASKITADFVYFNSTAECEAGTSSKSPGVVWVAPFGPSGTCGPFSFPPSINVPDSFKTNDPCHALCPDGVCNSMADHDKPECKACAECHDHDGDGEPDHGHDDSFSAVSAGFKFMPGDLTKFVVCDGLTLSSCLANLEGWSPTHRPEISDSEQGTGCGVLSDNNCFEISPLFARMFLSGMPELSPPPPPSLPPPPQPSSPTAQSSDSDNSGAVAALATLFALSAMANLALGYVFFTKRIRAKPVTLEITGTSFSDLRATTGVDSGPPRTTPNAVVSPQGAPADD